MARTGVPEVVGKGVPVRRSTSDSREDRFADDGAVQGLGVRSSVVARVIGKAIAEWRGVIGSQGYEAVFASVLRSDADQRQLVLVAERFLERCGGPLPSVRQHGGELFRAVSLSFNRISSETSERFLRGEDFISVIPLSLASNSCKRFSARFSTAGRES